MDMKKQVKDFWLNIDSWDFDQLTEARWIINDGIQACRSDMLQAGLSDFARRSTIDSIRIQGNMVIAIDKRLKELARV